MLGYFDGICEHYFFEEEKGFIAEAIRGENLRGWNDFLTIYGHISNPNKTLAEYTDAEWDFYIKQLEANDCITQFAKSIKG